MDLNTVTAVLQPRQRRDLPALVEGDALLAGGTWLFSEPQPSLSRLIDLTTLGWEPLVITPAGLEVAATCTFAQLEAFAGPEAAVSSRTAEGGAASGWSVLPLIRQCCRALLGSFKVWNQATVGGNLCLALPASPMAALFTALEAECRVWTPTGGERHIPVLDFIVGPSRTALRQGEVLRAVHAPARALRRHHAFRQISLSPLGRSGALLIGTFSEGEFALTVTASTVRPVRMLFQGYPAERVLADTIEAIIPASLYHDDVHGRPDWRRQVTHLLAQDIRAELQNGTAA